MSSPRTNRAIALFAVLSRYRLDPVRRFLRSDFARHSLVVFAAATVGNVMNYAFRFLSARYVTVAEYGELSAILAFVGLFAAPAAILGVVVMKYSSEFHAVNDVGRLKTLKRLVFMIGVGFSLVLVAVGALASPLIAQYLHITTKYAVEASALLVAVYFTVPSLWALLQGAQKFYVYAIAATLDGVFRVGLGLAAIFAGYHISGALFAYAAGGLVALTYAVFLLQRDDRGVVAERIRFDFQRLGQTLGGTTMTALAMSVLAGVDLVLVKHFFNPSASGLYAAVTVCGKVLFFIVGFLPAIVLPKAANLANRGESPRPILIQALFVATAVSGLALMIFFANPKLIITLVASAKYAAGSPYIFRYGLAMFLLACMNIIANYRVGIHSFGYVVPLVVAAVGEVFVIQFWAHGSFDQVIDTMLIGNALAVGLMLVGATKPHKATVFNPQEISQT